MLLNINNLIYRLEPNDKELRILASIISTLSKKKYESLIIFSIIIKLCATTFLMIYFLFVDSILLILLSGIGDGAMAIALIFAYRSNKYRNPEK